MKTSPIDPARAALPALQPDSVTRTLAALVGIESVNTSYGGPEGGEARVMAWVAEFLNSHGIASEQWDALPGRPDLRATVPGRDTGRTLMFETHIDTVSIAGMTVAPLAAEIRDGRMWGRGSTDAKGQAAAMLHAFVALKESDEPPPVNIDLVLACDEESCFGGVKSLVQRLKARGEKPVGAVVGEPTGLQVIVAHKGIQRWWIEVAGRAAHAAKPHLGVNAIQRAGWLTEAIEVGLASRLKERTHPLLGHGTINVSVIEGGTQVNMVPERARIYLDRRTLPGESREEVEAGMQDVIDELAAGRPDFRAVQEPALLDEPAFESDPSDPLVRAATELSRQFGRAPEPGGVDYGTDGSRLSEAGIPTIVVGPGSIDQAHTADEFIYLEELHAGALYYHALMRTGAAG